MNLRSFAAPLLACVLSAQAAAPVLPANESLRYEVKWPSGLSLGEATLGYQRQLRQDQDQWKQSLTIDASLPGFALKERVEATATAQSCALSLEKNSTRGAKTLQETMSFDQTKQMAVRKTKNGGSSDVPLPGCAKEPLGFLHSLREDLAAGRLPGPQPVYFGAAYVVSTKYVAKDKLPIADTPTEVDHLLLDVRGPASGFTIDLYLTRDPAHTPVLAKVPTVLGTFSMELVR